MHNKRLILDSLIEYIKENMNPFLKHLLKVRSDDLPSKQQLHLFRNYVILKKIELIKKYLNEREKVSGSDKWKNNIIKGQNLHDFLVKNVIKKVEEIENFQNDTKLFHINDFAVVLGNNNENQLYPFSEEYKVIMTKSILLYIVDLLILRVSNINVNNFFD